MDDKCPFSGTVKEYSEERYVFDKQKNENLDYKYVYKYNENHELSEVHGYNSKNKLTDISQYVYDDSRKLAEIIVKSARGNKKQRIIYEYTDNKLTQVTNIARSFKTIEKFDDYKNVTEEMFYGDESAPPYITRYKNIYDKDKRLKEKWTILPSNEIDHTESYLYDSKGLLVQETRINKASVRNDGKELPRSWESISKYTYDDKDNLVLSEFYSGGSASETHKKEINYDEYGDIAQIKDYRAFIWEDNFRLVSVTRYSYVR